MISTEEVTLILQFIIHKIIHDIAFYCLGG